MDLCYETLIPMHDVVVCILLTIYKFSCVACWECFALLESSWWNLMNILDECDAMFGLV